MKISDRMCQGKTEIPCIQKSSRVQGWPSSGKMSSELCGGSGVGTALRRPKRHRPPGTARL